MINRNAAIFLFLAFLQNFAHGEIYFKETFDDESETDWTTRWVRSGSKSSESGKFQLSPGNWTSNESDKGIQTTENYRFYFYSSKFKKPFSNTKKPLILQYSVKLENKVTCGGAYIKLLPFDFDQEKFDGESPYYVMFGPDICGTETEKVHAILNHKGKNLLIKEDIGCMTDKYTHVYTFALFPDKTYKILIDGTLKSSGNIYDKWEIDPPKTINDPKQSKPTDWIDEETIIDPKDQKPSDWDQPEEITDPKATKPTDWKDDLDGDWEAPMIPNPEYKGEWQPKSIKNPEYKGEWQHPQIDNPEYTHDTSAGEFMNIGGVGIELWQVTAGSLFDDIIVTDEMSEADDMADNESPVDSEEREALVVFEGKNNEEIEEEKEETKVHSEL